MGSFKTNISLGSDANCGIEELETISTRNLSVYSLISKFGIKLFLPFLTEETKQYRYTESIDKNVTEIAYFGLTEDAMPTVTSKKKIVNSKDVFTGCLNLTIERAPTIPRESAMFPEITVDMIEETRGKRAQLSLKLIFLAQP
ncbi:hypothetical protein HA152_06315 [Prochlorococcus marinus XMU1412]|uniref:hypothetical protein n=1 Tax=Prochlorococcus marinus TaxID=1219 RepID=UPI001AD98C45|nr:hypothetical protein [Prochlorococcus marinus]MBO8240316.1 hypothetical protein [Prochlorococcus marinus XMU1412]